MRVKEYSLTKRLKASSTAEPPKQNQRKIETITSIATRPEEKEQKAEEGGYLAAGGDLLEQGSKIAVDEL